MNFFLLFTFGPNIPTANWLKHLPIEPLSKFRSRDINFLLSPQQHAGFRLKWDGWEEQSPNVKISINERENTFLHFFLLYPNLLPLCSICKLEVAYVIPIARIRDITRTDLT